MTRIAIIDEDPAFLEMMRDVLSQAGYKVMLHSTAKTAFNLIRNRHPALVILDMQIGDLEDGWLILDLMRLDDQTAAIPVIMCSTDRRLLQSEASHLREEGCCMLVKPFAIADLLSLIQQTLAPGSRACREKHPPITRSTLRDQS